MAFFVAIQNKFDKNKRPATTRATTGFSTFFSFRCTYTTRGCNPLERTFCDQVKQTTLARKTKTNLLFGYLGL